MVVTENFTCTESEKVTLLKTSASVSQAKNVVQNEVTHIQSVLSRKFKKCFHQ